MAKFDLGKLSEKFDIKGIVDSVKSIINPEDIIPKTLEGDPVAAKLALIRTTNEGLSKLLEQQQQELAKINTLIASVLKDLEAAKQPTVTAAPIEPDQSPKSSDDESK